MKHPAVLVIPFNLPAKPPNIITPEDIPPSQVDTVQVLTLIRVLRYRHLSRSLQLEVLTDKGQIVLSFLLEKLTANV